jgi:demethylmenaquinone methyltransferase/2-methoxy-6-polyprenyl-1,4-benzoquinol methylase
MFKPSFIKEVFDNVASKYDLMNDLMSLGTHRLWKNKFCSLVGNLDSKILDVASGSGDIAFRLYNNAAKIGQKPHIILSDVNENMLQLAKDKAIDNNILSGLEYVLADATALPFDDNSFDYYTIAFGIRNIPDIHTTLSEAYRVLKPRSKFLCLEFSKPTAPLIRHMYDLYSDKVIPKIGEVVAGNIEAYEYLVNSIREFPDQNIFISMMQGAGFKNTYFQNLSFSIASIYVGYKP